MYRRSAPRRAAQATPRRAAQATPRLVAAVAAVLVLAGCTQTVNGRASLQNAASAELDVKNVDPDSSFDTTAQNALSDIEAFWNKRFPTLSGGKRLEPLRGGLFSVDGLQVAETGRLPAVIKSNACAAVSKSFVVDNGAFCVLDDSIVWDRSSTHLFARLAQRYGSFVVALIFAHEFGHAISYRLGVFDRHLPTIDTESQADCAAGAWAASALDHQDPHFLDVTPHKLDDALEGFLDGRDSTPGTPDDISHGNGFDRLSALADGLQHGVRYCYSPDYFDRTFTERPYTTQRDYDAGGNQSLAETKSANGSAIKDLNRFWLAQAEALGRTFTPVRIAEAAHPPCGLVPTTGEFGYCSGKNTVYVSAALASAAYHSLPDVDYDDRSANVRLVFHQPADFALGELFSIGWGLAVRRQFYGRTSTGRAALLSAVCYSGAYARDVNLASDPTGSRLLLLSPADLDEAVSALLDIVGQGRALGARGTTGLQRIQFFVTGYKQSRTAC